MLPLQPGGTPGARLSPVARKRQAGLVQEGHLIRAAHPQPSPSRSHLAAGKEQGEEQEYVGAIRDRMSMKGGQRGKSQLFVQGKIEGHEYEW